ncbi:MAG: hypothetical protein KAV98_00395 [Dehalococcoidia bacterium]|nr:hypothetical protein [Dehalococcoidia bacterium]
MANEYRLSLKNVIAILNKENSDCSVRWQKANLYDIAPWEFLSFARQDLEEKSERGVVNALSNAKRAIECRVDEILTLSNFRCFSSRYRWGLSYKLQVVKTFGLSAPRMLMDYIVLKRNLLEHEYAKPKDFEQARYVADIAELFLKASDAYVERGYIASATVTCREKLREEKNTRVDTRIFHKDLYELGFDLENEVVALSYTPRQVVQQWIKRTSTLREWLDPEASGEQINNSLAIRDCRMEDVRELMNLLGGKSD